MKNVFIWMMNWLQEKFLLGDPYLYQADRTNYFFPFLAFLTNNFT
jgi:hypothetical protein